MYAAVERAHETENENRHSDEWRFSFLSPHHLMRDRGCSYTESMQTRFVILGVIVIIALGALVFLFGRGNLQSDIGMRSVAAIDVPFEKLVEGTHSAVSTRKNYIITSEAQMKELWTLLDATTTPPVIDFSTHSVIAVFAGQDSCLDISVTRIEDTEDRMVSVEIAKASDSCAKGQSPTSPYEIVVIPATTLPLTHEDSSTTVSCPK